MIDLEKLIEERQGSPRLERILEESSPKLPTALDLITQLTGKSMEEILAEHEEHSSSEQSYQEVKDSAELQRILHLPRRHIDYESPEVANLVERFTAAFKKPTGTMRLKPIQAVALLEVFTVGGLIGPIRVGGGKTLVTYLTPMMYSVPQARPLLLIPASLKKKTIDAFRELSKHWKGPAPGAYRVESVQKLGRDWAGTKLGKASKEAGEPLLSLLDKYRPTLIVIDEAHLFKNPKAACTRKLARYLDANPEVKLVCLSGTLFRRSLKDFAPMTNRALGDLTPCPRTRNELDAWSGAIDEKVTSLARVQPGALVQLCNEEERIALSSTEGTDALDALRSAYGRRFVESTGVVASNEKELGTSIMFRELRIQKTDPELDRHFQHFRKLDITPMGLDVPDGISFKRHALEMALGFEYYWDPQPPEEWTLVRRAWGRLCRHILKHNRRHLDSAKQVADAIRLKVYPGIEVLEEWTKIEPTFIPNTIGHWFSSEVLDFAAEWAEREQGIIWVTHTAFAEALASKTGLAYYGRKGKTKDGVYIMDAKPGFPAIVSTAANKLGRDLQFHWYTNLVVSPEGDGLTWEQRSARTHRDGQPEDTVYIDWLANCAEHLSDFSQAIKDAGAQERMTGQPQKLLYGDHSRAEHRPEVEGLLGRWGYKG